MWGGGGSAVGWWVMRACAEAEVAVAIARKAIVETHKLRDALTHSERSLVAASEQVAKGKTLEGRVRLLEVVR